MKEARKLKKAQTTESEQALRDDSAAKKTTVAAEAMSNIATTSAAPKSEPSQSSTHSLGSPLISPPIADQISLAAYDQNWLIVPEAHGHPLLPELPNDITLAHILPKLGWRDFYTLSAVSPTWFHVIRTRQVYDERVRSRSTETFVLLCYERKERGRIVTAVAFYSMEDDFWFELPPIPALVGRLNPSRFKCVGLDGNVYLLGIPNRICSWILNTYVFDLTGQRHWRKCAAMEKEGYIYGKIDYGVLDGKIYSLNSRGSNKVYDPVKNTWSPIKPDMRCLRFGDHVGAEGDELYAFGGAGCDEFFDSDGNPVAGSPRNVQGLNYDFTRRPTNVQIYHSLRDEWRVVDGYHPNLIDKVVFEAQGKFHVLTGLRIYQYDLDAKQSTLLHSVSPQELLGPGDDAYQIYPIAAQAVGDELVASVTWHHGPSMENYKHEACILRCKGLRSQNKILIWHRARTPRFFPRPAAFSFQIMSHIHF